MNHSPALPCVARAGASSRPVWGRSDGNLRVHRTEASIIAWRHTASERRAAWQIAEAQRRAEARASREERLRWASGLTGFFMVAVLAVFAMLPSPPSSVSPEPAPAASIAWVGPEIPEIDSTGPVRTDSVQKWTTDEHRWLEFELATPEPAWLRWRDADGIPVMGEMQCFKATPEGHTCRAGRRHARIDHELAQGAAPGTWTVEVCTADECTQVTAFETGGRRESLS